jgi:hypothetical protein
MRHSAAPVLRSRKRPTAKDIEKCRDAVYVVHDQWLTAIVAFNDRTAVGVYAHPTLLYGISQQLMFFGQVSLPVHQDWRDPAGEESFRVGTGAMLELGS